MNRYAVFVTSLAAATGAAAADQSPGTHDAITELQSQVRQLQGEIDNLKAQSDQDWLTEKRADEIKGMVQDVLADADTRASLLQSGAVSGWDKGFFLMSSDGNYKLVIGGQLQIRHVYNFQDNSPTDDERGGFEVRRAKLILKGNVVDPSWTYDIQLAADRSTGAVSLEDAGWIQKDFGNGWKIRVGQMKAPFLREEILSSTRMLAVERSLVNSFFTAGTVQGLQVGWEGDRVHAYAMVHDGNKSGSASSRVWSTEDTEFAVSGRAEWLAFGEWKTLADYNSFKDEGTGLIIGGAVNWSKSEFGTGDGVIIPAPGVPDTTPNDVEVDNLGLTADVSWDLGGASLAGAIMYRRLDTDFTGVTMDQIGFLIRGGLFITNDWELYAQYEWADQDTTGLADLSVVTVGVTKYWAKHQLKWQCDIGYGFDTITSSIAQDSAGWRTDATGEDGQIVIRSQIQLLF